MNLWDEMWEIGSNDWSANAIVEAPASTPQNHRPFYASADALDEGLYARCIGRGLSSIATHDARRNLDSRRTRTVQRIRQKHANNLDKGHRLHERLTPIQLLQSPDSVNLQRAERHLYDLPSTGPVR